MRSYPLQRGQSKWVSRGIYPVPHSWNTEDFMIKYDGLKKHNLRGYYTTPVESDCHMRALKPDGGLQLSFFEKRITGREDPFSITALYVSINMPGKPIPIGYMEWYVFDSKGEWIDTEDFYWICDRVDQDTCDLAASITCEHQVGVGEMFMEGTFAELNRIELREIYLGKGYGVAAIQSFIARSLSRRRVHTIFIKPFPLQCENAAPCRDENPSVFAAYEEYADQATKSLSEYYQRALGAKPLNEHSDYLYVSLIEAMARR